MFALSKSLGFSYSDLLDMDHEDRIRFIKLHNEDVKRENEEVKKISRGKK